MDANKIWSCALDVVIEIFIKEIERYERNHRKITRRPWVRNWILRRFDLGASNRFLREVVIEDPETYRNHFRVDRCQFEFLLRKIYPLIKKADTNMREALSPSIKLEITLRYLATGDSFGTLESLYRVPKPTISKFLPHVCDAVYLVLKEFIKVPQDKKEWKEVERGFNVRWNFPNCAGALDGKHVNINCPAGSGSEFYNYKGTYSIVLFAVVDSDLCFLYIDVGKAGRSSDGGIFINSSLKQAMVSDALDLPNDYIFVADDAFALSNKIMKPFSRNRPLTFKEKIFNYRLSRARRTVENAFGVLAAVFRVFGKPIPLKISTVDKVVKATCALHNWLRKTSSRQYVPNSLIDFEDTEAGNVIPGSWREHASSGLTEIGRPSTGRRYAQTAADLRKNYAEYFIGKGAVPWQDKMI